MASLETPAGRSSCRSRFLGVALAAVVSCVGTAAEAQIFAPNFSANVSVHPAHATGNAPPMRTVGSNLTLASPRAVVVDRENDELFVASLLGNSIVVFSRFANGNAAPLRVLAGGTTQLASPRALDVDTENDELFVLSTGAVRVFARTADQNTAPLRSIAGALTQVGGDVRDLAVDAVHDELFVSLNNSGTPLQSALLVFARTAAGDVAPLRILSGATTGITGAFGVALDLVHDEVIVAGPSSVRVFARSAGGNVAPLRVISGPATGLAAGPLGVALDLERDQIAVSIPGSDSVRFFPRSANGDVAPVRVLAGALTGLDGINLFDLVPQIFADGFQTGGTGEWSLSVP